MIGLVLVTHGNLSLAFQQALEHVVGAQQQLEAIAIDVNDDMEKRRRDIMQAVEKVDRNRGVIILTDMFGGTPSNLAISLMGRKQLEVIAGVNLPLLIKLVTVRADLPLPEAVAQAREAARKYISVASEILGGDKTS